MKNENLTRLSIDVPQHIHTALKLHVIGQKTNIKDYVLNLIKEELADELDDYFLGQEALKAEKEGSLGVKKSKDFLQKLKKSK